MKKAIIAMLVMALLIAWPGAGIWVSIFPHLLGGGIAESYLYPIYGGIILLSGLVVGCTVYIADEIHSLKEEIRSLSSHSSNAAPASAKQGSDCSCSKEQ